tara:strand:+ start:1726 stop:1935 length:210 start_codon:yes stop_codon:yes gene_type:complete
MPTPKFKLEDQVIKKNVKGICLSLGTSIGEIIEVLEKHNKRGTICYYYDVRWADGRRSQHAQHILVPAP